MFALILYALLSLLAGSLICFFGKRLYLPVGGLLFTLLTFNICFERLGRGLGGILVAAGISLAGILLMRFFFQFGLLVIGGLCGALVGSAVLSLLPASIGQTGWVVVAACAAILAVCCLVWGDKLLAVTTAFTGASIMATPVCFFILEFGNLQGFISTGGLVSTMANLHTYLGGEFFFAHTLIILIATLVLAAASLLLQRLPSAPRHSTSA